MKILDIHNMVHDIVIRVQRAGIILVFGMMTKIIIEIVFRKIFNNVIHLCI